ncbi:MAG TPA: hypothetical protein VKB43_03760 [Gaiellaceae bacterium]|nr:hypothetical protein [Gaiellaceae bacterium]
MSSQQATQARPAAPGRVAAFLEENGLVVVVLGAFAIVLVVALRKDLVVDGWMALVSGRWIAQHGLPSHDTLTVWTHGRPWNDQQWLAQLGLYGLWRLGGIKLALLVHALLVISGIAGAALIARTRGASALGVTYVAIPVLLAYYPVASVMRPQSFAFPLFTATLWLILSDAQKPSRRVYLTLPLLVLWTNLHGSVLLGAMLVSLAGLVAIVQERRPSTRGLVLLLAPWACLFASPYALDLPSYYDKILIGGHFKKFVTEWAPTTLTPGTAAVYILVLGGLWLLGRAGREAPLLDQLAFLLTAVLAFEAVRNTAWVALVALAVLPPLVDRLRGPVQDPPRMNRILAITILATAVIALAAVAIKPTSWFTSGFPPGGAEAAVAAAGSQGRVFATSPYADWLLWSRPRLAGRVAFDARFELLSTKQLEQVARVQARSGDWLRTLRGYRVFVLSRQSGPSLEQGLIDRLHAHVVFSSPQVVVLRRRA